MPEGYTVSRASQASIDTLTTHWGGVVPLRSAVETAAVDSRTATTALQTTHPAARAPPSADMTRP
ncbi:hypothetical protein N802_11510 [Knoellia sinensis KCTC 19936]|uniref:Uncharacterized protein n=1 Tax=Knoellia sinensis KCTC 19936 TaxID=1385520 RepID=A0A0A0IWV4_9MICO|nr:hypothetical protein N802_11510 [Knoellia sinensis KCTC 19936]